MRFPDGAQHTEIVVDILGSAGFVISKHKKNGKEALGEEGKSPFKDVTGGLARPASLFRQSGVSLYVIVTVALLKT